MKQKIRSVRTVIVLLFILLVGVMASEVLFGQPAPGGSATGAAGAGGAGEAGAAGGGSRQRTFIIRDVPENLLKIEQIFRSLDVARKQVLIEALIFDVALDDNSAMGIDWSTFLAQPGRAGSLVQFDQTLGIAGGNGSIKFGTLKNEHFTMILKALRGNKRARSLSNPKITTTDGQQATISIGQRIPYYTTTTYPATGGNPPYTFRTTQFADVPISLTVSPTIYEDETIRMQVTPTVTAVVSLIPDSAPWTETRQAQTDVTVRNGETIILGGLITESKSEAQDHVPLFAKVPFLKKIFGKQEKSAKRSELVVFITPTLIQSQKVADFRKASLELPAQTR